MSYNFLYTKPKDNPITNISNINYNFSLISGNTTSSPATGIFMATWSVTYPAGSPASYSIYLPPNGWFLLNSLSSGVAQHVVTSPILLSNFTLNITPSIGTAVTTNFTVFKNSVSAVTISVTGPTTYTFDNNSTIACNQGDLISFNAFISHGVSNTKYAVSMSCCYARTS